MASKPYKYARFRVGGRVYLGETWSIGLAMQSGAAWTNGDLQAWLDGIAPDVMASYRTESSPWGKLAASGTTVEYLEAYGYDANSSTASAQARHQYGTPGNGAGITNNASMLAMVCTLLSDTPGRANQGRVYVPADGTPTNAGPYFGAGDCQIVVAGIVSLIDHLNGSTYAGGAVNVGVACKSAFRTITNVRSDDRPDTQRPRAGKATYSFTDNV
jgi:hypothetical protein